jgi:hypothetical protein
MTISVTERVARANKDLLLADGHLSDALYELYHALKEVEFHGDEYWALKREMQRLGNADISDIELED